MSYSFWRPPTLTPGRLPLCPPCYATVKYCGIDENILLKQKRDW